MKNLSAIFLSTLLMVLPVVEAWLDVQNCEVFCCENSEEASDAKSEKDGKPKEKNEWDYAFTVREISFGEIIQHRFTHRIVWSLNSSYSRIPEIPPEPLC